MNEIDEMRKLLTDINRQLDDMMGGFFLSAPSTSTSQLRSLQEMVQMLTTSGGWITDDTPWTRVSGIVFTTPGDLTEKYGKGMKLRWVQSGTTRYNYVASSAYSSPKTTVTIVNNLDGYTLTSGAVIRSPCYSYADTPQGFPAWFSYYTNWLAPTPPSIGNGTLVSRFSISGHTVTMNVYLLIGSTTNTGVGNWSWSPPMLALYSYMYAGGAVFYDATNGAFAGTAAMNAGTSTIYAWYGGSYIAAAVPFAWTTDDRLAFTLSYEI